MSTPRRRGDDLRGLGKLLVEATRAVTDVVADMHGAIGGPPARLFGAPTYAAIRTITRGVGLALDAGLAGLSPVLGEGPLRPELELALAALNGVVGDHLAATGNPLALSMRLLCPAPTEPRPKLLVLVHGSSMNRLSWRAATDLGASPVHVEYNSGLHVSTNGRELATRLEELVAGWPVAVEEIAIVAHSMGGLVARSACHYADEAGLAWRRRLRAIVFLGTPHHGAPLEQVGNWLGAALGVARQSAPLERLGRLRSAGVTDLRFGNVIDEHWSAADRFEPGGDARTPVPLPAGVACYAIAAEKDALVPRKSAFGEHRDPAATLDFPEERRAIARDASHVSMLHDPLVWSQIERWLGAAAS